uniref:Uncharacterized protein n=1 Tax=Arundo donax TaxID=35708 RepID=A0A0A9F3P6_ARUDO
MHFSLEGPMPNAIPMAKRSSAQTFTILRKPFGSYILSASSHGYSKFLKTTASHIEL